MHSLKERITKAREERTRAEQSKPISRDTEDKVKIREEITSANTCSKSNQSSVSSLIQAKQNNRKERTKVLQFGELTLF